MIFYEFQSRLNKQGVRLDISFAEFISKLADTKRTVETMSEYQQMDRLIKGDIKDVGGFVGGELERGKRSKQTTLNRCLITLDMDDGDNSSLEALDAFLRDKKAVVYSTHTHTPETPRLRVILALKEVLTPDEYTPVARYIAAQIGIDAFDDTTYEACRLMYYPSTCKDGEYYFKCYDGEEIDGKAILKEKFTDWTNVAEWPLSSRESERAVRPTSYGGKLKDPTTKNGVVGEFCKTYNIHEAISKFLPDVYIEAGDSRYTYNEATTFGGLVVYDNVYAYSHHASDPVSGHGPVNAFDLVRIHKFGALDEAIPTDTPINELPSTRAMIEFIKSDLEKDKDNKESQLRYAERLAKRIKNKVRYCDGLGWIIWNGYAWEENLYAARQYISGEIKRDGEMDANIYKRFETGAALKSIIYLLEGELYINVDKIDEDPFILNTPGGIVDLKTGELRPSNPDLFCSKATACTPGDSGKDEFLAFLELLTNGDKELIQYLQLTAGMSLIGKVYTEAVQFLHGDGHNGKSTYINTLKLVLNNYATKISSSILMYSKNGNHKPELALLRGIRLAIISETAEFGRLDTVALKQLASTDDINAEPKYYAPFSFEPTHTLFVATNYPPNVNSTDKATWRRLVMVPFGAEMPTGDAEITNYADYLFNNCGTYILKWMIEGAVRYFQDGCRILNVPKCVEEKSREYRETNDWISNFIYECCEVDKSFTCSGKDLYAAYREWCANIGEYTVRDNKAFASALREKGYESKHTKSGSAWIGLRRIIIDDPISYDEL